MAAFFISLAETIIHCANCAQPLSRRHDSAHLFSSLHFGAFWLLRGLRIADLGTSDAAVNGGILGSGLLFMTVYPFRAARRFFTPQSAWLTLGKALTGAIVFTLSLQTCRGALFFITFWST